MATTNRLAATLLATGESASAGSLTLTNERISLDLVCVQSGSVDSVIRMIVKDSIGRVLYSDSVEGTETQRQVLDSALLQTSGTMTVTVECLQGSATVTVNEITGTEGVTPGVTAGGIATADLADDAVTNAKIGPLAVDSTEIAVGAIDIAHLSAAASTLATVIADPGSAAAIPVTSSGSVSITTAAAETNTMAIPTFIGQQLSFNCDVYAVGDRVVTVAAAINIAGNTIMTFGAAADHIVLTAVQVAGGLLWRVTHNEGVALS